MCVSPPLPCATRAVRDRTRLFAVCRAVLCVAHRVSVPADLPLGERFVVAAQLIEDETKFRTQALQWTQQFATMGSS